MQREIKPMFPEVREADPDGRRDFESVRDLFYYLDNLPTDAQKVSDSEQ